MILATFWPRSTTVRCPQCLGYGRHRDTSQTTELTSLIPPSDRRLKPRRTKLLALATATLTALLIALLVFFYYPRSVSAEFGAVETIGLDIDQTPLNFTIRQPIVITNNNYGKVEVQPLSMAAYFYTLLAATVSVDKVTIPALSVRQMDFVFNVGENITGEFVSRVRRNCRGPKGVPKEINMQFRLSGAVKFFSYWHHLSLNDIFALNCSAASTNDTQSQSRHVA